MIIICGGIKGGGGKTTIALNLGIMRGLSGKDVLLVDADSIDNGNASDFSALRDEVLDKKYYTHVKINGKAIAKDIPSMAGKFDDIIIDVGGQDSLSQRAALTIADKLLIPVFPSSFDMWVIDSVSKLVEEVALINPKLQAYCFLNRADNSGTQNEETAHILKEDFSNITYLNTIIQNRKVFRTACANGLSIVEFKPKNTKAIEEIKFLYQQVFNEQFDN